MAQLALFPDSLGGPTGLRYQADFITAATEQGLVERIAALPLQRFQFGVFEGHRRVAWFGFRYDYDRQQLAPAEPIPGWLAPLTAQVETWGGLAADSVRQVLCTEYAAGVGIGWHRDKPHFDKVFGLSLAAPCKFRFRRRSGEKWERYTFEAMPRSLYMMDGEARSHWEHSIPPVEALRYSITFRTMKAGVRAA